MANFYLRGVDLKKDFRSRVLFSGVTLEVKVKNLIVLTGDSGSGKSTLLRMLFGEVKPDFGYVEKRKNLRRLKIEHQLIAKKKTIALSLRALGHKFGLKGEGLDKRISSLADDFGITQYLDEPIANLSAGVCQLASLAQAFLVPLDLVAFDEPLVYLTQKEIQVFLQQVARFNELGVGMIIVAANPYFFEKTATKIYELTNCNLKLLHDSNFVELMRPHLIFKREVYAEELPNYLLADERILKQDLTTLDLITKPANVNELTLELIKRGYTLKYFRYEII